MTRRVALSLKTQGCSSQKRWGWAKAVIQLNAGESQEHGRRHGEGGDPKQMLQRGAGGCADDEASESGAVFSNAIQHCEAMLGIRSRSSRQLEKVQGQLSHVARHDRGRCMTTE